MRADAQINRSEIVTAAWRLLASDGPEVSYRSIARAAGVGVATLHRHFPNMSDLLDALVQLLEERVDALCTHALSRWDEDVEAAWRGFVGGLVELRVGALAASFASQMHDLDSESASREEAARSVLNHIESVVRAAQEAQLAPGGMTALDLYVQTAIVGRTLPHAADTLAGTAQSSLVQIYTAGLQRLAQQDGAGRLEPEATPERQ